MSDTTKSGGGRHQRSWRNFLIDKDYQLRYTLISVVIAAILCGSLGALVIWQTREANAVFKRQRNKATNLFKRQREDTSALISKTRDAATRDVKKLLAVATDMLKVQLMDKDPDMREFAKKAMADLRKDDAAIVARRAKEDQRLGDLRARADTELVSQRKAQDKETMAKKRRKEIILLVAIIAFGIVFLIVIFIYNIVITHRVAGPMYKMGRYMDEVRDGKYTEVWNLRKGDQLVDLYGRFQAMHNAVKDRERQDIEAMDKVLAACGEAGVSGEAVDALKERLKAKRESVGDEAK
ncbi:MAG: hypothetical protein ABI333_06175 [bacterium]